MTWKTSAVLLRGWAAGFFPLFFVQYFLISTFTFQSCVFIRTQYQTALLILYCQWKIGFTCESVNTEFSQEATTKKPTLSKFLKHAAMRGAGCLLGPFYQGLPTLGLESLPSSSPARQGRCGSRWALVLPPARRPQKLNHTCFGGLTCHLVLFFSSAGFLITLSAELSKQWFLVLILHGNGRYSSRACRVRIEGVLQNNNF